LQIAEHCNREQFDALIGAYPGIVISDRWNGFEHRDPHQRQVCWSHYADSLVMPTWMRKWLQIGRSVAVLSA
jgi:hypothetical protein